MVASRSGLRSRSISGSTARTSCRRATSPWRSASIARFCVAPTSKIFRRAPGARAHRFEDRQARFVEVAEQCSRMARAVEARSSHRCDFVRLEELAPRAHARRPCRASRVARCAAPPAPGREVEFVRAAARWRGAPVSIRRPRKCSCADSAVRRPSAKSYSRLSSR